MADRGITQVGYDVARLVTECLWPRFKRHFDYWWCFPENVQGLRNEIGFCQRKRRRMEQDIEEARLRAESPTTEFEDWLKDGSNKLEDAERILQDCDDLKAWNIISRYSLGKMAKRETEVIAKLRNEGSSIKISDLAPLPATAVISHKPAMVFESRRRIEEEIMRYLKDDNVCIIAICGAGGIGKTTMVKGIEDWVKKEKLFDEVVHVVVSQQIDMLKIQEEIADQLGLMFSEKTLDSRKVKLNIRLRDSKKKIIVFDDVWKYFKLEDIGVPFGNCCKIILTSRVKDACQRMGAQVIPMGILSDVDAWTLFKEEAGSRVEAPDFLPIAEGIVAECKGLPLALVITGVALKDQSIHMWRDSLCQLRRSNPTDFPEVLEDVYKPIKLSYDFLENESESVKYLFLLCCLFPEDYNIPIEHLTRYGIGVGMFERIMNIQEGRDRTHNFVEKLKSRFLLLDGDWWQTVKMHDVVRDVAIYIGSKEKHGFFKILEVPSMDLSSKDLSDNCNWISIDIGIGNAKLPVGSDFPKLRLMVILDSTYSSEGFDGNIICFEGMEGLNVLCLSRKNLQSLPSTLELLKNLRTLHLQHCPVKDISGLGELASLEILSIQYCNLIEELPVDIGRLNRLKLLELSDCGGLRRIVAGVISSLVGLEELSVVHCYSVRWGAKDNQSEEGNVALSELGSLHRLTSLEIHNVDYNVFAEEIRISQQLVRYKINSFKEEYERSITLSLPEDITVGNWIRQLVKNTQSLGLDGDGSSTFNLGEIENLRNLGIEDCSTMNVIDCKFHALEHLQLYGLTELEKIIDDTIPERSNSFEKQNVSLGNLKSIYIRSCSNLCYLFSMAAARSLVQLQSLKIEYCEKIEQVFWNETESNTNASIIEHFPKLWELRLVNLPNLAAFSQGAEIIELHQLAQLHIIDCPKLRTKIRCSSRQIEDLTICNCDCTEELLWDEGERHVVFQELWNLVLDNLPSLTTFCKGVESIKFPVLQSMGIGKLGRMNNILFPLDSEATHEDHSLHLFCNPKVEFPSIENLSLLKLQDISKIWCCHVSINFFNKLIGLTLSDVNGVLNFISTSIAKNLVNLKYLDIVRCQEIVQVG